MKKLVLLIMLVLPVGAFAQSNTWSVSLLAGQQFRYANLEASATCTIAFGYALSKHWAIQAQLTGYQGEVKHNIHYGPPVFWSKELRSQFYLLSIGPEIMHDLGKHCQIYVQIMAGHTVGSTEGTFRLAYYSDNPPYHYPIKNVQNARQNKWTIAAALGFRFPWTEHVGLELRLSDTYYDNGFIYPQVGLWNGSHLKEIRLGITVRF